MFKLKSSGFDIKGPLWRLAFTSIVIMGIAEYMKKEMTIPIKIIDEMMAILLFVGSLLFIPKYEYVYENTIID
jgi:hypothetical protein